MKCLAGYFQDIFGGVQEVMANFLYGISPGWRQALVDEVVKFMDESDPGFRNDIGTPHQAVTEISRGRI